MDGEIQRLLDSAGAINYFAEKALFFRQSPNKGKSSAVLLNGQIFVLPPAIIFHIKVGSKN